MRLRVLTGISFVLVLILVQSALSAQRGSGGGNNTCTNVPISTTFANDPGDRITGDGAAYEGTLFVCGSNDATFATGKRRFVALNFGTFVPNSGQPDSWMTGEVALEMNFNIHKLGTIRSGTMTTYMTGQFTGPNSKTYRLRMTPYEVETGSVELLPDGESVNTPYITAPVTVTFVEGCGSTAGCTNPFGMWEVVGHNPTTDMFYEQIGTIYKVGNTWIKMGQLALPFKVTVTALASLPQ